MVRASRLWWWCLMDVQGARRLEPLHREAPLPPPSAWSLAPPRLSLHLLHTQWLPGHLWALACSRSQKDWKKYKKKFLKIQRHMSLESLFTILAHFSQSKDLISIRQLFSFYLLCILLTWNQFWSDLWSRPICTQCLWFPFEGQSVNRAPVSEAYPDMRQAGQHLLGCGDFWNIKRNHAYSKSFESSVKCI